jgi:hypothetical protein
VHLRPGVWVSRRWSIPEIQQLHDDGTLTQAARDAVATVLDALGEAPLTPRA